MKTIPSVSTIALLVLSFACSASAAIELGAPFSDGMVLQRGMRVPVWGTVSQELTPRRVAVSFAGQRKYASVNPVTGAWRVELDPLEASGESRMLVVSIEPDSWTERLFRDDKETVEVRDVLVGEVWFASGQSNMECPIWGTNPRYRDAKGALMTMMTHLPSVRYVKVPRRWSPELIAQKAEWKKFTPDELQCFSRINTAVGGPNTRASLSAVAFYYARELYLALGIPVGIIDASWGGTNIDAWTPRCGYENCDPSIRETADFEIRTEKTWKSSRDQKGPVTAPHQQPTVLWNGMVGAFAPMAMRGFIWYQGCHNNGEPQLYTAKMQALYEGWSKAFENPALKLYFAELAPYDQNWNGICAAQEKFVDIQTNAALAVTADVGNFNDIHPNDKEIVAKRLVVHALKRDYGFDIPEDCSPRFKSVSFEEGKAILLFSHVKKWYVYAPDCAHDPAFEIAGEDGVWQPAKILNFDTWKDKKGNVRQKDLIDASRIVLASEKVSKPVRVRYMARPKTMSTLYNEASLPLGVFETK